MMPLDESCDRCVGDGRVRVTRLVTQYGRRTQPLDLVFCARHFSIHEQALAAARWNKVEDRR